MRVSDYEIDDLVILRCGGNYTARERRCITDGAQAQYEHDKKDYDELKTELTAWVSTFDGLWEDYTQLKKAMETMVEITPEEARAALARIMVFPPYTMAVSRSFDEPIKSVIAKLKPIAGRDEESSN